MTKDNVMLFVIGVIAVVAVAGGVIAHSAKAVSSSLDHGEHTMTTEEMNYFLNRINYGSK